jgi:hypothetical protein
MGHYELPFDFEVPMSVFEKADAEPGKQRRIGGIASLESKDRQGEIILQRGLDFNDFLHNGWFNDNHSKRTADILGYPEMVQFFRKGQVMPDSNKAPADGHWVEGYLLETEKADEIWNLSRALAKTKRRLGFSVEGKIQKRQGPKNKTIAQALVRNVAITNCPVHTGARMEALAKSLQVAEQTDDGFLDKALAMGPITDPGTKVSGVQTGVGAGRVITPQSLESSQKTLFSILDEEDEDEGKKSLSDAEAFAWYRTRMPTASPVQIGRLIMIAKRLKEIGKL